MIERLAQLPDGVEISVSGGPSRFYSWRWLRDHGDDPGSLDPSTFQRVVDTFAMPADLAGTATLSSDGRAVHVVWCDGAPATRCSLAVFEGLTDELADTDVDLWSCGAGVMVRPFTHGDVIADDATLATWMNELAVQGFAVLEGVPTTEAAATELARRIAEPRSTVFGSMWRLESDMTAHRDSAYTTDYLEPHTDATYMTDAPGTQMFCCLERTGDGGESILVDGFAIADEIRRSHPEAFDVLTTVAVPGRYLEPGVHLAAERPVVRTDQSGRIVQVSLNNYDRAPFWLPEPEMSAFYEAYGLFQAFVVDRERWFELRLEPGDALIFDNWRVLHGRRSYSGRRLFYGCYHNRDDVQSRRRVLRRLSGDAEDVSG